MHLRRQINVAEIARMHLHCMQNYKSINTVVSSVFCELGVDLFYIYLCKYEMLKKMQRKATMKVNRQ